MTRKKEGRIGRSTIWKWIGITALLIIGLAGLVYGVRGLRGTYRGSPVAAAFTRVGGPTRVETAIDASRFWFKPPACFVTIPASASQGIMLRAARFAMARDAPLLYVPRNLKRRQRVRTLIVNWRAEARARHRVRPARITAQSLNHATGCRGKKLPPSVGKLSTLWASQVFLPRRFRVTTHKTLAPVVVFAIDRRPGDPADVAVGLALAAHLARKEPAVSLVILPRYLQADPGLENQLRGQRTVVKGGVVLGSAGILTPDTQALLRQILTSPDQQAILSQKQAILTSAGSVLAGVLPLIGGAAAAAGAVLLVVVPLVIPFITGDARRKDDPGGSGPPSEPPRGNGETDMWPFDGTAPKTAPGGPAGTDWYDLLTSDFQSQYVTVWLRNGWQVAGTFKVPGGSNGQSQSGNHADPPKIFQFLHAKVFKPQDGEYLELSPANPQRTVAVSVSDIGFIGVGFQVETVSHQGRQPRARAGAPTGS